MSVPEAFVIALPGVLVLYFAALYAGAYALFRSTAPARMQRSSAAAYLVFLGAALGILSGSTSLSKQFGIPDLAALWLLVAVVSGIGLFVMEHRISKTLSRWTASFGTRTRMLLDGGTHRLTHRAHNRVAFITQSGATAVGEELLYRGMSQQVLTDGTHLGPWQSAVIVSVVFGAAHYYFGLRNVGLKTIDGMAWSALSIWTGSLLAPIVSHLCFQLCVERQLHRMTSIAATSATVAMTSRSGLTSQELSQELGARP